MIGACLMLICMYVCVAAPIVGVWSLAVLLWQLFLTNSLRSLETLNLVTAQSSDLCFIYCTSTLTLYNTTPTLNRPGYSSMGRL